MIDIEIPKDIRKYESKFVGPFTLRQTVSIVIGSACALITYNTIGKFFPADSKALLCFITATPGLLFGWIKPYGMTLEQFLKITIITYFLAPAKRKYKTRNKYDEYEPDYVNELKAEKAKRLKSVKNFNRRNKKQEFLSYK